MGRQGEGQLLKLPTGTGSLRDHLTLIPKVASRWASRNAILVIDYFWEQGEGGANGWGLSTPPTILLLRVMEEREGREKGADPKERQGA